MALAGPLATDWIGNRTASLKGIMLPSLLEIKIGQP